MNHTTVGEEINELIISLLKIYDLTMHDLNKIKNDHTCKYGKSPNILRLPPRIQVMGMDIRFDSLVHGPMVDREPIS